MPPANRGGRPRKLNDSQVNDLNLHCEKKELLTRQDCVVHCQSVFHKKVSKQTITYEFKKVNVKSYVARIKPPVSKKNRKKRAAWAKENINMAFNNVISADEVNVNTQHLRAPRYHLGTVETRNICIPQKLSNVTVSIWACLSSAGPGPICVISGTTSAKRYQEVLKKKFVEYYHRLDTEGNPAYYMHDNAPIHTAQSSMNFFEENGITLFPIPPYSPDTNPIENVWSHLKQEISKRTGTFPNLNDVTRAAEAAWADLPVHLCKTLMDGMRRRCVLILKNHGNMTKY